MALSEDLEEDVRRKSESDIEAQAGGAFTSFDISNKVKQPHAGSDTEEGYGSEKTLDWDSPDDPDNPMNWPNAKKIFHTMLPALFGFTITVGTSAYVPAIPFIMEQFHVEREIAVLPLSMFTCGFVIGPLVAAPLSEIFGRRIIYWTTLPMLFIFLGIAGTSNSVPLLIVMRLLAGTGGSGTLAIGAGTIADLWDKKSSGKAALGFVMAPFLGPSLGPLTGAYVISQYHDNWRWSMWVVIIIGAPIFLLSLFMQETSKSRILQLREKKRNGKVDHHVGDTHLLLSKVGQGLIRPFHMMFVEPLVGFLSIYTGFAFAMMFSFVGSYSYVFESVYHFNQKEVGLTFLGILVGFILAIVSFGIFDATIYRKEAAKANDNPAPEHRLYAAMLGSVLLPIGLFWFAWSPHEDVHWIVPVLAGVPFGWGSLDIFISATAYLVDVYQASNGASAVAANGILRYGLGAAFPLFTIQMYQAMGIHWAGSVFGFVAVAMMPVPWIFFWKGKLLRARSHYDTFKED